MHLRISFFLYDVLSTKQLIAMLRKLSEVLLSDMPEVPVPEGLQDRRIRTGVR